MAKIRKRVWKNKSGKHVCYEITYVIDGKQYRKSGYKSLIDAQIDLPNVITDCSTDIRFKRLTEIFLDKHCKVKCKKSTTELYERYISIHFDYLMPKMVKDIAHKDIENLILQLLNKNLSNGTINKLIQLLRVIFNYGIENNFVSRCPILKTDKLPVEKKGINVLDETQVCSFLECAREKSYKTYAILATALYTGIRRGELLALEWRDIDFKNNKIRINKQVYKGESVTTKSNKERSVDIPENLINILKEYRNGLTVISKIVFPNNSGGYMHPGLLEKAHFYSILKSVNKDVAEEDKIKIRYHDLRHTYATFLLSKGVPIKYVQEQLGHSSAKMTLDVYASYMPSVKFEALQILNNLGKIEHKLSMKNQNTGITRDITNG